MAAVTADTLTLDRIATGTADDVERPVRVGHHRARRVWRAKAFPSAARWPA